MNEGSRIALGQINSLQNVFSNVKITVQLLQGNC